MSDIVEQGMVVSITYTLKDEKGDLFEYREIPVNYLHGSGTQLFPKIEQALDGKSVGDQVTVKLSSEEGFGQYDPGLTFSDALFNVPEEYRRIGAEFEARNDLGETRIFRVSSIEDGKVNFDANHPLVGQAVEFTVKVVDIRPATDEEMAHGEAAPDPGIPTLQ